MEKGITKEASSTNKRIEWIDELKGLAIFLVTLGHFNVYAPVEKYIYSFHMFLFFFLAGYLFTVKNKKETIKKRIMRLLIPFISWNVLSASLGYFFIEKDFHNFIEELWVLKGNLTFNSPIWFLLVLFITEIIVIVFSIYKQKWISIIAIISSICLWILFGDKWLLWKINLVPMALAFFLLGFVLKPIVPKLCKWYILLPLGIGSVIFASLNIRIVYTYGRFGNYFYCILAAVFGVLFFVGVFSGIKKYKYFGFLKRWSHNSLAIMATQFYIFRFISFISVKFLDQDLMEMQNSIISLILALITIVLINICVECIKKMGKKSMLVRKAGILFGIQ